jgi:YcxB-like protein
MQIDYELTQGDFIEAFTAHRYRSVGRKWLTRLFMSITLVLAAILLSGLILKPDAHDAKILTPYFVFTFLWIGAMLVLPRRSAKKQFLKQPGAHGPRTILIDAMGVHWRWNGGSSDIAWKNYVRAVEGRSQFLLYTSPACFNIIPKRALSSDGLLELRRILEQNIS